MQDNQDAEVDRSWLTLLSGRPLTASSAGSLGGPPPSPGRDPCSPSTRQKDALEEERPGGEGGGGSP